MLKGFPIADALYIDANDNACLLCSGMLVPLFFNDYLVVEKKGETVRISFKLKDPDGFIFFSHRVI